MCKTMLLLACLAFASYGRRARLVAEHTQERPNLLKASALRSDESRLLAKFLLAFNPAMGQGRMTRRLGAHQSAGWHRSAALRLADSVPESKPESEPKLESTPESETEDESEDKPEDEFVISPEELEKSQTLAGVLGITTSGVVLLTEVGYIATGAGYPDGLLGVVLGVPYIVCWLVFFGVLGNALDKDERERVGPGPGGILNVADLVAKLAGGALVVILVLGFLLGRLPLFPPIDDAVGAVKQFSDEA